MKRVIFIITIVLLLVSCAKNPFSARDSEEPSKQAGTFIPPTSPEIVLENLKLSYQELVIGNYMQTIDSAFIFRFDYVEGVLLDSIWGFSTEVNLTENLFNEIQFSGGLQSLDVELTPQEGQVDIVLDTAATLIRGYVVSVVDSLGNVLEKYQGVAQFEMVEGSFNYWTLLVWEDYHLDTEKQSWADFKNLYR